MYRSTLLQLLPCSPSRDQLKQINTLTCGFWLRTSTFKISKHELWRAKKVHYTIILFHYSKVNGKLKKNVLPFSPFLFHFMLLMSLLICFICNILHTMTHTQFHWSNSIIYIHHYMSCENIEFIVIQLQVWHKNPAGTHQLSIPWTKLI